MWVCVNFLDRLVFIWVTKRFLDKKRWGTIKCYVEGSPIILLVYESKWFIILCDHLWGIAKDRNNINEGDRNTINTYHCQYLQNNNTVATYNSFYFFYYYLKLCLIIIWINKMVVNSNLLLSQKIRLWQKILEKSP